MKKIVQSITVIFSLLLLISCDVEPVDNGLLLNDNTSVNPTNPTNPTGAVFKADFGGQTWSATQYSANIFNGKIEIGGVKPSGEAFAFLLNGTSVGTYPSTSNLIAYIPPTGVNEYIAFNPANPTAVVGSVMVTTIDAANHTISGVFNFTGYWDDYSVTNVPPINFTNGVFTNIPYTTINTNTDSFFAKVDGTEFVEDSIDVTEVIASGFPDAYSIVGKNTNGDNVGLWIAQSLGVGTYQITGPFGTEVNSTCLFGGVLYNGVSGSITIISKANGRLKGTFSLVDQNMTTLATKTISEGTFDVELP